jgi:hypothetical protein
MDLLAQGRARLTCGGEQLTLHLSARLFPPELWKNLCRGFKTEGSKGNWMVAPFHLMT